jgi:cytosine/adenosine deaminase-related metal-dependent hydrolase
VRTGLFLDGGGIAVRAGVVRNVLATPRAVARAAGSARTRVVDLGGGLLVPGFVDAHAHLELSGFRDQLPRGGAFADWIRALVPLRRRRALDDLARDWRAGAERLAQTGTTLVGDVDSTGAIDRAVPASPLRVRAYREVLDAGDPTRARAALARLDELGEPRSRRYSGLSPHAPYTVSRTLWDELARRASHAHCAVHFAETREEVEWLEQGSGPWSGFLAHTPRESGLDSIERALGLSPRVALIHGNHATRAERERIARAGAALVHCPGTHAYFAREPFDAGAWLESGAVLALGTDSLASNDDLDMGREMALFSAAHAHLAPRVVFDAATRGGARALGFSGRAGELSPGAWADFALFEMEPASERDALEALTRAPARPRGVWVGGRSSLPSLC